MPLTFKENMFKGINNDKANIIHNGNVLSVMKVCKYGSCTFLGYNIFGTYITYVDGLSVYKWPSSTYSIFHLANQKYLILLFLCILCQ